MKIPIVLFFAMTLFLGVQNADAAKCKYAENKVDPFTKVKSLTTKWDQLTSSWMQNQRELNASISVNSVGDELQLWVSLDYTRQTQNGPSEYELQDTIVILEEAPLLIMMADGSITTLVAIDEVRNNAYSLAPEDHDHETSKFTVRAVAFIRYALPADAVEALSSQPATDIRITAADRDFDIKIHKKSFDDFQNAIGCIQL